MHAFRFTNITNFESMRDEFRTAIATKSKSKSKEGEGSEINLELPEEKQFFRFDLARTIFLERGL